MEARNILQNFLCLFANLARESSAIADGYTDVVDERTDTADECSFIGDGGTFLRVPVDFFL